MKTVEFRFQIDPRRGRPPPNTRWAELHEGMCRARLMAACSAFGLTEDQAEALDGKLLRVTAEQYGEFHVHRIKGAPPAPGEGPCETRFVSPGEPSVVDLTAGPPPPSRPAYRYEPRTGLPVHANCRSAALRAEEPSPCREVVVLESVGMRALSVSASGPDRGHVQFRGSPTARIEVGQTVAFGGDDGRLRLGTVAKTFSGQRGSMRVTVSPNEKED